MGNHSRELHKHIKGDEKMAYNITKTKNGFINDSMDVINNHTEFWIPKWKADGKQEIEEVIAIRKQYRDEAFNQQNRGVWQRRLSTRRHQKGGETFRTRHGHRNGWMGLQRVAHMQDLVLAELANLLSSIKKHLAMPTGGSRTVAIVSTTYRPPQSL